MVAVLAAMLGVGTVSRAAPGSFTVPGTMGPRRMHPEDRYALAGGCYRISSPLARTVVAAPILFRATDLGRYLMFDADGRFLTGRGDGLSREPAASPESDWQVDELGGGDFTIGLPATGQVLSSDRSGNLHLARNPSVEATRFRFRRAGGCRAFPEVDLNVSGPHVQGSDPAAEVTGFIDTHLHMTAFEFLGGRAHCGRPWHAYGVTAALADCPEHYVADGSAAVLDNFFAQGSPLGNHDPVGWPTFRDWPAPRSLTHEQTYYRWVERAWRGGLRGLVNLFVENRVLCELYPLKKNDCDEMASVRLQAERFRALERYIDAQNGGPGEGWFRIVTDPVTARAVMNEGRLAVILGVEVSELFGCSVRLNVPQCSAADIDRELADLHGLGVRQVAVVHKFDNALGGTMFDGGAVGNLVNLGQFYASGRFWSAETCDPDNTGVHDNDQSLPEGLDQATTPAAAAIGQAGAGGVVPIYPEPHHCNTRGLTRLGAHAISAIADRGMLVDIDHMSVKARQQALDLLAARGYPGVISSHSWATPDAYDRIYAAGGFTAPYAGDSTGFAGAWQERRAAARAAGGDGFFGIGFGADSNGLGTQGGPRQGAAANPVTYPFVGLGGVIVDRQVSGERVFDINRDGVAHYGLYPDWIEDLRKIAGDEIVDDLGRGAEGYLRTWERAEDRR